MDWEQLFLVLIARSVTRRCLNLKALLLQSSLATIDDTPVMLMSDASGAQEAMSAFYSVALENPMNSCLFKKIRDLLCKSICQ